MTKIRAAAKSSIPPGFIRRLLEDETGQDLIEYALVAALIGLGAVASMKTLSTKVGAAFTTVGTSLTSNV